VLAHQRGEAQPGLGDDNALAPAFRELRAEERLQLANLAAVERLP
jgi:hypothetical protein